LVEIAGKAHADQHEAEHEAQYVRAFMTKDADGQPYLNYISWDSVVENSGMDHENYPLYLADIANIHVRVFGGSTRRCFANAWRS
jgi:hypothetical protein